MVDRTPADMLAETIVPHLLNGVRTLFCSRPGSWNTIEFFPSEFVLVSPVSLHKLCSVICILLAKLN
jgi:hypothetical protein